MAHHKSQEELISKKDARKMALNGQLLVKNKPLSTLKIIRELGYVQIDTISVVERAHHHTLWVRNHNYHKDEINELLRSGKVFEYWSHAASYLPIEDYRFCLTTMENYQCGKKHWFNRDLKVEKFVLDRIKAEGPLMSKDFKTQKKSNGWYDWKPTKKALEQLFMAGDLMVKERKGFQKVYDLKENILTKDINTKKPTLIEHARYLILRQLKSLGIARINEISYLRSTDIKTLVKKVINEMVKEGEVVKVRIKDSEDFFYCLPNNLETIAAINFDPKVHILSPFDNLLIQRKRMKDLFDFDYQIECYVPTPKRKYGYFCLPILHKDQFIGRIDLKANRQAKELELKGIFWEKSPNPSLKRQVQDQLKSFAKFNQCELGFKL